MGILSMTRPRLFFPTLRVAKALLARSTGSKRPPETRVALVHSDETCAEIEGVMVHWEKR